MNHYASSNFTTPTTVTIETGALPWTHWAAQIGSQVPDRLRTATIGDSLTKAGYDTVMISANENASPLHHGTFGGYSDLEIAPSRSLRSEVYKWLLVFPDASLTTFFESVLAFLGTVDIYMSGQQNPFDAAKVYSRGLDVIAHQPANRPLFLWLHTLAPHAPYLPPDTSRYTLLPRGTLDRWDEFMPENSHYAENKQKFIDAHHLRYDECVKGADLELGRFIAALVKIGRFDGSVIIISADHGDSFEKGYLGHAGGLLHNALIHIPLVIKLPAQNTARRVVVATSEADIAPTIAELSGASVPQFAEGRSLVPALTGRRFSSQAVYSMSFERQSRFHPLEAGHFAVVDGRFKLVYDDATNRSMLFDLTSDPNERFDIYDQYPVISNELRRDLLSRIALAENSRLKNVSEW